MCLSVARDNPHVFIEEWFGERCQNIYLPVPTIQSESEEFLLHEGSYVHGVSPSYLSLLPANHTAWEVDWKSQALESIYHWTLLVEII